MSKVKWWVKDKEKANQLGKRSPYILSDVRDILFNWERNANSGVKFIKVTYGRKDYIEFHLYHMEKFQRSLLEHKLPGQKDIVIIYDKYDLVVSSENFSSQTVDKMIQKIFKSYKVNKRKHVLNETYDLDEVNCILMEVDEILEDHENYAVLDMLTESL